MLTKDNFSFWLIFYDAKKYWKTQKIIFTQVFHLNKWSVSAMISASHQKWQVAGTSPSINLSNKLGSGCLS